MIKKSILKNEKCKIFNNPFPKLIFFSGKGGVGKTTCSSSLGILFAEIGYKTLIISTDPAHSLGDSFSIRLKPGIITAHSSIKDLFLLEIELNHQNIEGKKNNSFLTDVFFPTSEEFLIIYEIAKLISKIYTEKSIFDYIIFDMAPSGHSLRLLKFPKKLKNYIEQINKINKKFRKHGLINNNSVKMNIEKNITNLKIFIKILQNPYITEFILVGIPEYMSIIESKRFYQSLKNLNIKCDYFILNKIENSSNRLNCPFCLKRQDYQKKNIEFCEKTFNNFSLIKIPLSSSEINNLKELNIVKEFLKSLI
ncbi:MAG: ArsA family ATPase [Promethearchaeota archaeon]